MSSETWIQLISRKEDRKPGPTLHASPPPSLGGEKWQLVLDFHRPPFDFIRGRSKETAENVMPAHPSFRNRDPERFSGITAGYRVATPK
jgi:hypothetical protein